MEKREIYLLSPRHYEGVRLLPMIDFEPMVESIDFGDADTLLFTSKQAVVTAEAIDPSWKRLPAIVVGSATKAEVEGLGGTVIHTPKSHYGEVLAEDILQHFSDRKILFLRPEKVAFDFKAYIEKHRNNEGELPVVFEEEITYRTVCKYYPPVEQPEKGAIIIFTSPSTISCFLKSFHWDEGYTAVVIGKTTLEKLSPEMEAVVAEEATILSCIEKAKSL